MVTKKTDFSFKSSNGLNTVRGIKITPADGSCKAVLQISHGMVEHYDRYTDFMEFMAEQGLAVYMNDHIGHKHSVDNDDQLGFFAHKDGHIHILNDLVTTAKMAKTDYPDAKLFLLGHSMGSFYARVFAAEHSHLLDGVIISGTGGPNKAAVRGKMAILAMMKLKGEMYRSKDIVKMMFGKYLDKIEKPNTASDWITRDEEIVAKYCMDKYCQFTFTLAGFRDLMDILIWANDKNTYEKTPDNLPVLVFSGSMDPVGDYGVGIMQVVDGYKSAGCTDLELKLYDGGRHEMLNEINRDEVYADVLEWLCKKAEG